MAVTDAGTEIHLNPPVIRYLDRVEYEPCWRAMQSFTEARDDDTPDELWVLEHPPVYTVGVAGRDRHLPRGAAGSPTIPVMRIDRGGQITYHGPGQAVVYTLVDLARRGIKVREMVCILEQAVIALLAEYGVAGEGRPGAPGIYIPRQDGAKIAALGLKVRQGCCFHGVALNVDLDLAPFNDIDPCGYPGLPVTRTTDLGIAGTTPQLGAALARHISARITTSQAASCAPTDSPTEIHVHASRD